MRMPSMKTIDYLTRITNREDFDDLSLQEIGDILGVTRERVRQLLVILGIKKSRKSSKLTVATRGYSDTDLIELGLKMGGATPLARMLKISPERFYRELERRGITTQSLKPESIRQKCLKDPELARKYNTQRHMDYYYRHQPEMIAYARKRREMFPEKHKQYVETWKRNHPEKVAEIRSRTKCRYWKARGTDKCPACGMAHTPDAKNNS